MSVVSYMFVFLQTAEYETCMKQQDVTFKSEVKTIVTQEPSVVISQFEKDQERVTAPVSFVSETVISSMHL